MIEEFADWLIQTPLSLFVANTTDVRTWLIIPMSQTIHIVAVASVMMSAGILNLRLAGVRTSQQSFAEMSDQYMPWLWGGLIVLLTTGVVQTLGEPPRELMSITFRTKMVMLLGVLAITLYAQSFLKADPDYWDLTPERKHTAQRLGILALVLWIAIAAAGRLIAYIG